MVRSARVRVDPCEHLAIPGAPIIHARSPKAEQIQSLPLTITIITTGQGIAYAAKQAGLACTVVVIETAPTSKVERMRSLGARTRRKILVGGIVFAKADRACCRNPY